MNTQDLKKVHVAISNEDFSKSLDDYLIENCSDFFEFFSEYNFDTLIKSQFNEISRADFDTLITLCVISNKILNKTIISGIEQFIILDKFICEYFIKGETPLSKISSAFEYVIFNKHNSEHSNGFDKYYEQKVYMSNNVF